MNKLSFHILVTGVTRGLGLSLADFFLENGHRVIGLGRRKSDGMKDLEKKHGERFAFYGADVTNEKQLLDAYEAIKGKTPHLDILVNNAAVHLEQQKPDLDEIDFSVYQQTFLVNSIAPLMVIKAFIPLLKAGDKKLVINISSEAGSIGNAWRKTEYSYCMSKTALNMASKILQTRFREEGIKILAMHPGWFSSDMGGKEAPITPEQAAARVGRTILKKWSLKDPIYIDADAKEMVW
ncbi:MAG: SDR family NAD(P)-dependent oxidoreductase [Spirochaetales bacterium]|nr:SDR family NAD(P)-dependent oxidoreductase [Spirochaetales bacterium]